jgi:hypothetical protein
MIVSNPFSRRTFLTHASGAFLVAMVEYHPLTRLATSGGTGARSAPQTFRVVRSDDQLDVLIELNDVEVAGDQLRAVGPDPFVRLTFGAQHTAEELLTAADPVPTTSLGALSAGPSVLVAPVNATVPFTLAGILDLARAALAGQATAGVPARSVTAVEVPAGFVLSPVSGARLEAGATPVTNAGTTEVWTARLLPAVGSGPLALAAVANLATASTLPPNSIPTEQDRADIVDNSIAVASLQGRQLWLSSSGAFARIHGEWDGGVGVARYDHRVSTGRDTRVEVVSTGYLLPFGQRVAITEVAGRVVVADTGGADTAVERLSRHLTMIEPVTSTGRSFEAHSGRGLPFLSTVATADATVDVELADVVDANGSIAGVSLVRVAGTDVDVVVDYLATDRGGSPVSFQIPAVFIDDDVAFQTAANGAPARVRAAVNSLLPELRDLDLHGQRVAYADAVSPGSNTAKATHGFRLTWTGPDGAPTEQQLRDAGTPGVYVELQSADVVDDAIAAVTGSTGDTVGVRPHQRWLDFGNDAAENFDLSFLTLDTAVSAIVGDDVVGAVTSLELVGEVFNQLLGLGPNISSLAEWTPAAAIGEKSTIIGGISLLSLIEAAANEVLDDALPGLTVSVDGDVVTAQYTFSRSLGSVPNVGFEAGAATKCVIVSTTTASLSDDVEASFTTEARVEEFKLNFPPAPAATLVIVDFESVTATMSSDNSSSVVPRVRGWDFSGIISMLTALFDGLGLGNVDLKIVGDTLVLDASIGLPDIDMGVVSVKNFSVNTGMNLPLGPGAGLVSVGLGSKSSPVDVDVLMFGGTFWVEVGVSFGGQNPPESVIGAGVSVYWEMVDFDIVVVHISFALRLSADFRLSGNDVVFTGAVSLEGNIEVLGLLDVSASITASLTYKSESEELILKGTVHYAVDSFLGKLTSGTIPIGTTSFELGSSGTSAAFGPGRSAHLRASPAAAGASFVDRYTVPVWADYCDAFA